MDRRWVTDMILQPGSSMVSWTNWCLCWKISTSMVNLMLGCLLWNGKSGAFCMHAFSFGAKNASHLCISIKSYEWSCPILELIYSFTALFLLIRWWTQWCLQENKSCMAYKQVHKALPQILHEGNVHQSWQLSHLPALYSRFWWPHSYGYEGWDNIRGWQQLGSAL